MSHDSAGSDDPYESSWPICCLHDYDHPMSHRRPDWQKPVSECKHFPFHPAPGCYLIDFWHTRFADLIDENCSKESMDRAYAAFLKAQKSGEWILPMTHIRSCRVCGCTQNHACEGKE
jgi:hypothetical protein